MILALDIATSTGCAVGDPADAPRAWSVDLGRGSSDDARFAAVMVLTHRLIEEFKPRLIAIEAPVAGPKTSHLLVGLAACVRGVAHNRRIRVEPYHVGAIRKHFVGRNLRARDFPAKNFGGAKKAIKGEVLQACRWRGWEVADDDAADAAALWDYACAMSGLARPPSGGLFRARAED